MGCVYHCRRTLARALVRSVERASCKRSMSGVSQMYDDEQADGNHWRCYDEKKAAITAAAFVSSISSDNKTR